jgi:acetyl esterase/lipase
MPSLIARAIKFGASRSIKHTPATQESLVRHLRRYMNQSPPALMPFGISVQPFSEQGLKGDRLGVKAPGQVILYLHGGGYLCGKTRTYFNFCSRLAKELDAEVWLPDYRLAPEHPFPAAVEDALASYELLLKKGWRADQITIAGDSAGGGLTLGTLLALRDRGRPLPKCAVVLSPFADVRSTSPSVHQNDASDAMLGHAMLAMGRYLYARSPQDEINPYASPALGDYRGLPPLFITVCEQECLRDDAYAVAQQARAAGVEVTLLSRPDLLHVWPIFVPLMAEARDDLASIINFIRGASRG